MGKAEQTTAAAGTGAGAAAASTSSEEWSAWHAGLFGRRNRALLLTGLQAAGSAAIAAGAVVLAYAMEQGLARTEGRGLFAGLAAAPFQERFRPYLPLALLAPVLYVLILQWLGLYRRPRGQIRPFSQAGTVAQGALLGSLILVSAAATLGGRLSLTGDGFTLLFFLYVTLLVFFGILLFHSGTLIATLLLHAAGVGRRRVAVVAGTAETPLTLALQDPSSEYQLEGVVALQPLAEGIGTPWIGSIDEMDSLINDHDLDEIVLAADPSELTADQRVELALTCWKLGADLKMVAPFWPFFHTTAQPEVIGDVSLLQVERAGLYATWSQILKRATDIAISLGALAAVSPVLIAAAIAIRLDSPGPVLFVQPRVGLNGRRFRMLKFRSMKHNCDPDLHKKYLEKLIREGKAEVDEEGRPVYKMTDDPRITRVGKIIRKISVDELPQLINVLRGEMSLVGPRPPLPYEVEQYEDWHLKRLNIRPGITGLWQVSGRSRLSFEEMVRLDIRYIEEWSLWLDIKILLRTIPVVLKLDQSY